MAALCKETLRAVTDAITFRGDERVLDVACGTGELEWRLLERWPALSLTGCDLSVGMLAQARSKPIAGDVVWIQADATAFPFPDASFDTVICANSFHYIRTPEQSLAEMRRALRPGGRLVLVDWCDDYLELPRVQPLAAVDRPGVLPDVLAGRVPFAH